MSTDINALVREMQRAVPSFSPNDEYVQDGLTYYIINDLGRFICKSALDDSWDEVKMAVEFLDGLLVEGKPETIRLVGDCIWGLLDCPAYREIQSLFGDHLRRLSAEYPPK